MFTGLIETMGAVTSVEAQGGGRRLWIEATSLLADARIGDSIAVDGCCLTAVALDGGRFAVDAVPETLSRTTVGALAAGDPVNLERPLRLDQRLGGHLVQGHVDGVGTVERVTAEGGGARVVFAVPPVLRRFVAEKGSIAIDGVSLTVAACDDARFEIAYIPHTLAVTTAGRYAPGRAVNLEVDLLARYLARLLEERTWEASR